MNGEMHEGDATQRRSFLKKAAVVAGSAWVAPVVLSQSAFAQGSSGRFSQSFGGEVQDFQLSPCTGAFMTVVGTSATEGDVTLTGSGARIVDIVWAVATVSITPPLPLVAPGAAHAIVASPPSSYTVTWECVP